MRKVKVLRFLVDAHIFTVCAATALASKTSLILNGDLGDFHISALVFSSTLCYYSFYSLQSQSSISSRHTLMSSCLFIGLAIAALQLFYLPIRIFILMIPPLIIAAGYFLPLIKLNNSFRRLRDLPGMKIVFIAFCYSYITTLLPIAKESNISLVSTGCLLRFLLNFLFVAAVAIPFDIRDLAYDSKRGVKTIPVILGVEGAIKIAFWLLFLFCLVAVLLLVLFQLIKPLQMLAFIVSALITAFLLPLAKKQRSNAFYSVVFEGCIILQWLLVLIGTRV
jgi:4-hydroxybenzoate polyprenyltransferase